MLIVLQLSWTDTWRWLDHPDQADDVKKSRLGHFSFGGKVTTYTGRAVGVATKVTQWEQNSGRQFDAGAKVIQKISART